MLLQTRTRSTTPNLMLALVAIFLALQVGFSFTLPHPTGKATELHPPPTRKLLSSVNLGEPVIAAQFMTLYLQSYDTQPGVSLRYLDLDYARVIDWLRTILDVDPAGQYPLLMASHLYAQVPDMQKKREMLNFVYEQFLLDPNRRWPWLVHAVVIAKHRLKDLPLARKYAEAITQNANAANVPGWAKQMRIFILEDMGELESAKIILGGLLESGNIKDPHEIRFLTEKLQALVDEEKSSMPTKK